MLHIDVIALMLWFLLLSHSILQILKCYTSIYINLVFFVRLVNKLGELSGEEIRDPNFTVHHPLNAFRFIRNHSVIYNETAMKLIEEIRLYEKGKTSQYHIVFLYKFLFIFLNYYIFFTEFIIYDVFYVCQKH